MRTRDSLYRAARQALRWLPEGRAKDRLREALRDEHHRLAHVDRCEGCERTVDDRHLLYWMKFHDPYAMGLYCPACRRLLKRGEMPPAWKAAVAQFAPRRRRSRKS
jgi:hypothetical protein